MSAEKITGALILTVVLLLLGALAHDVYEGIRLKQQCLDDGFKEYQCRAMVRL